MGLHAAALKHLARMGQDRLFDGAERTVIELGSQDLIAYFDTCALNIDLVFHMFGITQYDRSKVKMGNPARHLYEALGFRYNCIDIDNRPGTLRWDLNTVQCPEDFRGKHFLTTNFGTSEHVIHQENCFRLIHDLTAVGGYMVHNVPCTGYTNHCFFSYHPLFFARMAGANGYDMLYPCLNVGYGSTEIQSIPAVGAPYPATCGFACVLRKTKDTEFAYPYQTGYPYPMIWWDAKSMVDMKPKS
ncbi:MAG: hypothetical protein H7837_09805 [Magnetococcus sp. MYC-9]